MSFMLPCSRYSNVLRAHWPSLRTRAAHIAPMPAALTGYVELMNDLDGKVQQPLGKDPVPGRSSLGTRVKVAWKEDNMNEYLLKIHCMAGALHLLLDTTILSFCKESMTWCSH